MQSEPDIHPSTLPHHPAWDLLEEVLEEGGGCLLILDSQDHFARAGTSFLERFQLQQERAAGRCLADLIGPDLARALLEGEDVWLPGAGGEGPPQLFRVRRREVLSDGRQILALVMRRPSPTLAPWEHEDAGLEALPVPFLWLDTEGRIAWSNRHFLELSQRTEKEVRKKPWWGFLPKREREGVEALWRDRRQRPDPWKLESRILLPNGIELPVRLHLQGVTGGCLVTFQEASRERRLRSELVELQKDHFRAQEMAHIGTWSWDLRQGIFRLSQQACRIYDLNSGYFQGHESDLEKLPFHAEDREFVLQALRKAKEEHHLQSLRFRVVNRQGRIRTVELEARLERDIDGKPVRLFGTLRDITHLSKTERELQLLARAIEQTSDAIVVTDVKGHITYVNPAFCKITGFQESEALGRPASLLSSGLHEPEFYRDLWQTILDGRPWMGMFTNRRKDGSLYREEASITPVLGDHGVIEHFVMVARDATAQHQWEEQIQQIQRMESAGRLASGVAHDFNNLLTPILGYAEIMLYDTSPGDTGFKELDEIRKAAERAKEMVGKLRAIGREQPLKMEVMDPNLVIRGLEDMLRRSLRDDVVFELQLAEDLPNIHADSLQLERVLVNLAINAQDSMPDGGTLRILSKTASLDRRFVRTHPGAHPGLQVELVIEDSGQGMAPEVLKHAFEPFYTTKEEGTGLGLAIVHGIIQQHGGHIQIETGLGHGTCFHLYLPAVQAQANPHRPIGQQKFINGHQRRALVVDDDASVVELLQAVLQSAGFAVETASGGEQVLERRQQGPIPVDLLITDVVMPKMSGLDLEKKLREFHPEMKVLFTSGYFDIQRYRIRKGPQHAFLAKPFNMKELTSAIRGLMESQV